MAWSAMAITTPTPRASTAPPGSPTTLRPDLSIYESDQGTGWGHNVFTGTQVYRSRELTARSKWLWTPDESDTVTLAMDYSNAKSDVGSAVTVYPGSEALFGYKNPGFYNTDEDTADPASTYTWWDVSLKGGARHVLVETGEHIELSGSA